jgi:hypothetical protein
MNGKGMAWQGKGMGATWERHGIFELVFVGLGHEAKCSLWDATLRHEQVAALPITLAVTRITYRVRGKQDMSSRRHVAHLFNCQQWRKRILICRSIVASLQRDPTLTRGVIYTAGLYRPRGLI